MSTQHLNLSKSIRNQSKNTSKLIQKSEVIAIARVLLTRPWGEAIVDILDGDPLGPIPHQEEAVVGLVLFPILYEVSHQKIFLHFYFRGVNRVLSYKTHHKMS